MKKSIILIVICNILFLSCEKNENKIEYELTNDEAKELITEWIYTEYNPQMNPALDFSLKEYTTNEIYLKLKGQVFGIVTNTPGLDSKRVFIKNNKVYDLLPGFQYISGTDFSNMVVTDLNKDNKYELIYTGHAGSGILYQAINCFYFLNETEVNVILGAVYPMPIDYKISLHKKSYNDLKIRYNDSNYNQDIGSVKLEKKEAELELIIEYKEDIPDEIKNKLNENF